MQLTVVKQPIKTSYMCVWNFYWNKLDLKLFFCYRLECVTKVSVYRKLVESTRKKNPYHPLIWRIFFAVVFILFKMSKLWYVQINKTSNTLEHVKNPNMVFQLVFTTTNWNWMCQRSVIRLEKHFTKFLIVYE